MSYTLSNPFGKQEGGLGEVHAFHVEETVARPVPDCKIVNEMTSEYTLILLLGERVCRERSNFG